MKAAFHFDVGNNRFGNPFGHRVEELVFTTVHKRPTLAISSKIYVGGLELHLICDDEASFQRAAEKWLESARNGWHRFTKRASGLFQTDIWIVCFDAIDKTTASSLHERLSHHEGYLAAVEINDGDELHWHFYSDALTLRYRVTGRHIVVFSDAFSDQPTDEEMDEDHKRLTGIGFKKLAFASSEGKHSIFDRYHDFEHARHIAEWREKFGEMLAFVADNVVTKLGDVAPELGEKLWAAYDTFERAETKEQLAQVCVSCRRIIQYTADTLFPPKESQPGEKPLGPGNYRNRLIAFAEDQAKSGTNIDVICSSLELLKEHLDKLDQLANKGVHAEVTLEGTRRCLIRTVLLLDDIISLRPRQFQIKTELDFSILDPKTIP